MHNLAWSTQKLGDFGVLLGRYPGETPCFVTIDNYGDTIEWFGYSYGYSLVLEVAPLPRKGDIDGWMDADSAPFGDIVLGCNNDSEELFPLFVDQNGAWTWDGGDRKPATFTNWRPLQ